jgi:hypothetical protein
MATHVLPLLVSPYDADTSGVGRQKRPLLKKYRLPVTQSKVVLGKITSPRGFLHPPTSSIPETWKGEKREKGRILFTVNSNSTKKEGRSTRSECVPIFLIRYITGIDRYNKKSPSRDNQPAFSPVENRDNSTTVNPQQTLHRLSLSCKLARWPAFSARGTPARFLFLHAAFPTNWKCEEKVPLRWVTTCTRGTFTFSNGARIQKFYTWPQYSQYSNNIPTI